MRDPEILRHLHRRYRLIKSGGLVLLLFFGLNFCPLHAAVVKMPSAATDTITSSADHPGAIVANTAPVTQFLTPIPEIGVLFPIIGLVVAISLTQLLRRRRISQQRSSSPNGR